MAAARWPLAVGAAVTVASVFLVALPSPRCAAAASDDAASSSSLDCATVTSLLSGCKAFVRRGEAAASPYARRGVLRRRTPPTTGGRCARAWPGSCGRRYSSNASAIALLPVLCGVLPPPAGRCAVGDTLTYCTSPS